MPTLLSNLSLPAAAVAAITAIASAAPGDEAKFAPDAAGFRAIAQPYFERHCVACHGADYLGGWSAVSCYQCHDGPNGNHPEGNRSASRVGSTVRTRVGSPISVRSTRPPRGSSRTSSRSDSAPATRSDASSTKPRGATNPPT